MRILFPALVVIVVVASGALCFPSQARGEGRAGSLLAGGAAGAARPAPPLMDLLDTASRAMHRARETGDPTWYGHARAAVDRAVALAPGDLAVLRTKAWVLLGQHEFGEARVLAEQAVAWSPHDWMSWANLTDASVELGDYARAVVAADRLGMLRPGVAAYTRVAGLQALFGDRVAAIATLELAAAAALGDAEAHAWVLVHLGHEHLALGDPDAASTAYERALDRVADYHLALAGLARARAAQGRIGEAIDVALRAVERVPAPALHGLLADLYARQGDPAEAARQLDTVLVMERLAAAQGGSHGREVALVLADHDLEPALALRTARADFARRPDIFGDDVLAWTLHKAGRHADAKRAASRALRLGTQDAALHYHAGMIAAALGRSTAAARHLERALALAPAFDVRQAPMARATLDALRDTRLAAAGGQGAP